MRIPHVRELYLDEAEGFLLEHALISPPRTWPPLPATQTDRLTQNRKKMDWDGEVRANPDEAVVIPTRSDDGHGDANKERCCICLMALRDRTIVGVCGHEFCFECIGVWANQSRRCPLCSAEMAPFLLHDLDAAQPTKASPFYLPPLPQRKLPSASQPSSSRIARAEAGRQRVQEEMDELDIQVERRREIYQHELFVKHIGSNPITKFVPNPTPRQIADDPVLTQRATAFLRRELRVWSLVDVEFLTTYILSLLKAIDIRSEPAVRLLADFLNTDDLPRGAEQFAHEVYSWLRSPYKELRKYDEIAQYDPVPDSHRHSPSPSRSPSPSSSRSPSRSRSHSLSPLSSYSSRSRSPPRIPGQRDSYVPDRRRWNEPDVWLDPEYERWLESEKKRKAERLERNKRRRLDDRDRMNPRPMRQWGSTERRDKVELLPSPPPAPLRMDEPPTTKLPSTASSSVHEARQAKAAAKLLSIKGAAHALFPSGAAEGSEAEAKRQKLLDRLAKARAENSKTAAAAASASTSTPTPPLEPEPASALGSAEEVTISKGRGLRARIQLKIKLESEKATFRHNVNESKAQELRRRLLDAKARREAEETDLTLKRLDAIDRRRELRRRLMVVKMMAAETDSERRARELREKLMARKHGMAAAVAVDGPAVVA